MKIKKSIKVLIAIDFDSSAQKVADEGYALAKAFSAEVILLHVISNPLYFDSVKHPAIMEFDGYKDIIPLPTDSSEKLEIISQQFLDKSKFYPGVETIQTLIKEGDFADSILEVSKDVHADIIVMGSHCQKWLENVLMGSVTEKVLHHTTLPLLIISTKNNSCRAQTYS